MEASALTWGLGEGCARPGPPRTPGGVGGGGGAPGGAPGEQGLRPAVGFGVKGRPGLHFLGRPLPPSRHHLWGLRSPPRRFSTLTRPTCLPAPQQTPEVMGSEIPVKTYEHVTPFPPTAKPRPHCAPRGPWPVPPSLPSHPSSPSMLFCLVQSSRPVPRAGGGTSSSRALCGECFPELIAGLGPTCLGLSRTSPTLRVPSPR